MKTVQPGDSFALRRYARSETLESGAPALPQRILTARLAGATLRRKMSLKPEGSVPAIVIPPQAVSALTDGAARVTESQISEINRWSPRRTLCFTIAASLFLWSGIALLVYSLFAL